MQKLLTRHSTKTLFKLLGKRDLFEEDRIVQNLYWEENLYTDKK